MLTRLTKRIPGNRPVVQSRPSRPARKGASRKGGTRHEFTARSR